VNRGGTAVDVARRAGHQRPDKLELHVEKCRDFRSSESPQAHEAARPSTVATTWVDVTYKLPSQRFLTVCATSLATRHCSNKSATASGVRLQVDLPALATLPPTARLPKTERGPISTSGPTISVCHRTRRSLRKIHPYLPPLAIVHRLTIPSCPDPLTASGSRRTCRSAITQSLSAPGLSLDGRFPRSSGTKQARS
jgi:hypothetical protein